MGIKLINHMCSCSSPSTCMHYHRHPHTLRNHSCKIISGLIHASIHVVCKYKHIYIHRILTNKHTYIHSTSIPSLHLRTKILPLGSIILSRHVHQSIYLHRQCGLHKLEPYMPSFCLRAINRPSQELIPTQPTLLSQARTYNNPRSTYKQNEK